MHLKFVECRNGFFKTRTTTNKNKLVFFGGGTGKVIHALGSLGKSFNAKWKRNQKCVSGWGEGGGGRDGDGEQRFLSRFHRVPPSPPLPLLFF